jgi:glucan phosphorylase
LSIWISIMVKRYKASDSQWARIASFLPGKLIVAGVLREAVRRAKHVAKLEFAQWLAEASGVTVDPDSIFDCQVKRIHEYKRQLLNALRVVVLYDRIRQNPDLQTHPRTFFFAGKVAPAYHLAKMIIEFLNNLAGIIDADPVVKDRLKIPPAGVRRLAGRAPDPRGRRVQPDLDGGL